MKPFILLSSRAAQSFAVEVHLRVCVTGSSKGSEEGLDLDKLVSVEEILNIVAWDSWCSDFFSPLQILLLSIILLLT